MKIDTPVREIIAGGILTALALFFQSAPLWLSGIGLFISPLATLPVALAAALSIPLGAVVYTAAAFLLMLADPQEAAIFLLATGLLGMASGFSRTREHRVLIPAAALCIGLLALTNLGLIPVFGGITPRSVLLQIPVYALFSLLYAALWVTGIKYILPLVEKIHLFD